MSYTYGDQNHKHAVTALSNGNTYSYDSNGNITYRHVYEGGSWKNYTLVYDAENRLTTVSGPVTANFKYDGDTGFAGASSKRVRATINGGLDTVFIGNYFEWNVTAGTKRTYYYAGATRIAMRDNGAAPQWILGDHLGSTSKMVSYAGADTGGQWYKAWGETRLQTGTIPTKYQYTGQYNQVIIGLYYYGARWYDAVLSRWTQPDSIIPEASQGVQAWDRYTYTNNSPLIFTDPTGHWSCKSDAYDQNCDYEEQTTLLPDDLGGNSDDNSSEPMIPSPPSNATIYSISGTAGLFSWFISGGFDILINNNQIGVFSVTAVGPLAGGSKISGANTVVNLEGSTFASPQLGISIVQGNINGINLATNIQSYEGTSYIQGASVGTDSSIIIEFTQQVGSNGLPNDNNSGILAGASFGLTPIFEAHSYYTYANYLESASHFLTIIYNGFQ